MHGRMNDYGCILFGLFIVEVIMTMNDAALKVFNLSGALEYSGYPYVNRVMLSNGLLSNRKFRRYPLIDILETIARHVSYGDISDAQHPSLQLLIELMESRVLIGELSWGGLNPYSSKILINELNDLLDDFVRISNGEEFKKRIHNLYRMEKRNALSMRDYINHLFNCYSRLLVLRIDFHYTRSLADDVCLEKAIEDRERFLKRTKKEFDHLEGLCWKLEYGDNRKFHYHMVFFFNGAYQQQDIKIAQQLGELWEDITDGQGTYYNCNHGKERYSECYLGMVTHHDENKRNAMKYLEYLVKRDEKILLLQCRGKVRTFGRMETPTRRSAAGRPRLINFSS